MEFSSEVSFKLVIVFYPLVNEGVAIITPLYQSDLGNHGELRKNEVHRCCLGKGIGAFSKIRQNSNFILATMSDWLWHGGVCGWLELRRVFFY